MSKDKKGGSFFVRKSIVKKKGVMITIPEEETTAFSDRSNEVVEPPKEKPFSNFRKSFKNLSGKFSKSLRLSEKESKNSNPEEVNIQIDKSKLSLPTESE